MADTDVSYSVGPYVLSSEHKIISQVTTNRRHNTAELAPYVPNDRRNAWRTNSHNQSFSPTRLRFYPPTIDWSSSLEVFQQART
jgi:hypothetical protein